MPATNTPPSERKRLRIDLEWSDRTSLLRNLSIVLGALAEVDMPIGSSPTPVLARSSGLGSYAPWS